ncbi:flagellar basal body-associated FliL family protein, partial [Escherichia coli]|uniref:flagellar basal body-associated FliL family protein n=2 Tax=Pseudomonadota TaxID=1224 RepID=UPI001954E079
FMIVPGDGIAPDGLKEKLPLVLDSFQPFLRELRPEDLSGSAAVFRIKEEMMVRATATLGEGQVKDILIQDLV